MATANITREHEKTCITNCPYDDGEDCYCNIGHHCWCTADNARDLGLDDPDDVGISAYRTIFEALDDILSNAAEDEEDGPEMCVAELDELIATARSIRERILTGVR